MKIVLAMSTLGSPKNPEIYWRTNQNAMTWCTAFSLFRGKPMRTTELRFASRATMWFAKTIPGHWSLRRCGVPFKFG